MALTKVSTDGVKDDAITSGKIPANQIEASELADNAVDTNAIANNAVTAGKLASGVQTTINNNADNRLITGSGTANTLNGEANLTFSSSLLASDGNGSSNLGGNYLLLKRTSGTTNYLNAPLADGELYISADEAIRFATVHTADFNSTERMRLTSAGQLVIGQTYSSAKFEVVDNGYSSSSVLQRISADDSNPYALIIGNNTCNNGAANGLQFFVNNTGEHFIRARASSTAANNNLTIAAQNNIYFSSGASETERLRIQAGGGISFNGDSAAANALNDYEEGTWTPTTGNSGGGFANVVSATYTKIGRLVNVSMYANFNSSQPNSNQIRIGGLPFQSTGSVYHFAVGRLQGFAANDIVWQVGGTSDYFTPYYNNSIPTYNQVGGYYLLISATYHTS